MTIGLIIFAAGVVFSVISTVSFRMRALFNKPAWGGITLPCAMIAGVLLVISLVIIYLTYPK